MHLLNTNEVDARFSEIKALAKAEQPLSDEGLQSAADVAAYDAVRGIFSDLHFRRMCTAELTARGNRARAQYIRDKRSELLDKLIYKQHQEAYKRAQVSCDKLCKWTDADGDADAMLDTLEVYIHALTGEASLVTAKAICDVLRRELLSVSKEPEKEIDAEFEKLWQEYPRKQGKKEAKKAFERARRNGVALETIEKGLSAYKEYIKTNKIETSFVKQGSTWFKNEAWNDDFSQISNRGSVYGSDASYDLEAYRQSAIGLRDYTPKGETA